MGEFTAENGHIYESVEITDTQTARLTILNRIAQAQRQLSNCQRILNEEQTRLANFDAAISQLTG